MIVITGDCIFWNSVKTKKFDLGEKFGEEPYVCREIIHTSQLMQWAESLSRYNIVVTIDLNLIDALRLLRKQGKIEDLVFVFAKTVGFEFEYTEYKVDNDGRVDSVFWNNDSMDCSYIIEGLLF